MLFEDGWLVEAEGDARRPLMPAAEAPATVLGFARHNVQNALAAAGAALGMGVDRDTVAEGLRAFRPTAEQAPGRVNLYRLGSRLVIIDFAHNEAGISVVLDLAEAIAGPRGRRRLPLTVVVGAAGDRPDDTLRGIGRIAATRADRLGVKETLKYLRGRSRESAVGEILAGMVAGGAKRSQIPIYDDEPSALRAVLADGATGASEAREIAARKAREPDVVVLTVHADREGVKDVLTELGARAVGAEALSDLVQPSQAALPH